MLAMTAAATLPVLLLVAALTNGHQTCFAPGSSCGVSTEITTVNSIGETEDLSGLNCAIIKGQENCKRYHDWKPHWVYITEWSDCSVICGGGTMNRTRRCVSRGQTISASNCFGPEDLVRRCNIAPCMTVEVGKTGFQATASAPYTYNWPDYEAAKAVDLIVSHENTNYFHTASTSADEWLQVDMGAEHFVSAIYFDTRYDSSFLVGNMVELDVRVGNTPVPTSGLQDISNINTQCMYYNDGEEGKFYDGGDCDQPIKGQYVTIQQKDSAKEFYVNEIYVHALIQAHNCIKNPDSCNRVELSNAGFTATATSDLSGNHLAENAVDGTVSAIPNSGFWSPASTDPLQWILVDMGQEHLIAAIHMDSRQDWGGTQIRDIDLRIGNNSPGNTALQHIHMNFRCMFLPGNVAQTYHEFECATPLLGKYITLQKKTQGSNWDVNEIHVYALQEAA